jgi:hypothetical protein
MLGAKDQLAMRIVLGLEDYKTKLDKGTQELDHGNFALFRSSMYSIVQALWQYELIPLYLLGSVSISLSSTRRAPIEN